MAISLDTLTNHSRRFSASENLYKSSQRSRKAFLCHSHLDAQYVKGFIQLLKEENIDVYVDWQDSSMPENTNRETAVKIQQKIKETDYFFFSQHRTLLNQDGALGKLVMLMESKIMNLYS